MAWRFIEPARRLEVATKAFKYVWSQLLSKLFYRSEGLQILADQAKARIGIRVRPSHAKVFSADWCFTMRFNEAEIDWSVVERQLLAWGSYFVLVNFFKLIYVKI